MVRVYGPRAAKTWKLVKIGPFPSPRYSDMEYIGITKFFFRAILYAGHIRTFTFHSRAIPSTSKIFMFLTFCFSTVSISMEESTSCFTYGEKV